MPLLYTALRFLSTLLRDDDTVTRWWQLRTDYAYEEFSSVLVFLFVRQSTNVGELLLVSLALSDSFILMLLMLWIFNSHFASTSSSDTAIQGT